jgi:hypothetical protein
VTSSRSLLLLAVLLAACVALTQARAAPLDSETCNKLMIEQSALENAGVEQTMAKGPEWAKANLTPEKIDQIRRFIELEELIVFRCRSRVRVTLPPDPEDKEPDQEKDNNKDQAKDAQDKSGEAKQETVVVKTPPSSAKAKDPVTRAEPKAETAPEPKADAKKQKTQPAKKPAGEQAGKAGDAKAQPKTAPKKQEKQAAPDAKAQAKPPTQPAPKAAPGGASQKAPPKAKVEDEP